MNRNVESDFSLISLDNMFVDNYAFFVPMRLVCSSSFEEVNVEVKSNES